MQSETTDVPKILIADDDDAIRPLVAAICSRLGFVCHSAADGDEALQKIREDGYDVVLLDLMMPKVNGYEVIEALREKPDRPAVIVLTAQGPRQTEGLVDGNIVQAIVHKPFDLTELMTLLTDTARGMREQKRKRASK